MSDQDRTSQDDRNREDDRRKRANQDAASRPGVDANNALDDRGFATSTPHEGSAFEPLRMGSDEDRQREENSNYAIDQGAEGGSGERHGVSRGGSPTQHGDTIRESQSAPGGGSVFQPLEASPRNEEDLEAKQRGNPSGQNQQGLNDRSYDEDRRGYGSPGGPAADQDKRRP